jgi:recombination protein RecA
MSLETFLATLDPKTAARVKTAENTEVVRLPLASYGITECLGGGIAKGHITLLYGNQSAGKSMVALESIAKWQSMGLVCALVDTERVYDKAWGARLGVNNDELILIQSKASGKIEDELRPLIYNKIDVVVIDSISEIMPDAFIDQKTGELMDQDHRKQMGAQAKAIKQLITGIEYMNEGDTAFLMLSQTTTEIGQTYVKQIPHGGKKMLFAASQIIKITSSNTEAKQIKGKDYVGTQVFETLIGRSVDAIVEKNKLGKQWTTCSYDIYYAGDSVGIDRVGEVVDEAIKFGAIKKGGAWFTFAEQQFQGRPALVKFFKGEPDQLDDAILAVAAVKSGE